MATTDARLDRDRVGELTARMLFEAGAVHVSWDHPFVFAAGWASPVYIDCRQLIAFPRLRRALVDLAVARLCQEAGFEAFDAVAGAETAGIPFAAWIADRLMLPMQYVRKQPLGIGRNAQVEGVVREGARTLLIDDLATDGRSKVGFVRGLREAGAQVEHLLVIFYHAVFPGTAQRMRELEVEAHALATWVDILRVGAAHGHLDTSTCAKLERFLADPAAWSAAYGGRASAPAS